MKHFDLLRAYSDTAILAVGEPSATATKTIRDLRADIEAVAAQLPVFDQSDQRHQPTDILVTCQDRYHLTVVLLAAWRQGRVVALPPNAREETLQQLAPRCAMALHDGAGIGTNVVDWLARVPRVSTAADARALRVTADQPLVTIYTSGSTGTPTACRKTAAQLLGEGATLQQTFQLTPESCVLATVPAHHIYGLLFTVVLPLFAGARFVRDTPLLPSVIEDYARRYHANVLVSVPPHLRVLGESELSSLAGIHQVFSSGAPLPDASAHTLRKRFGVDVIEVLGSTETGGFAYRRFDDQDPSQAARFRPFPGVSIATDEADQLCLRSPLLDAAVAQPLLCPDRIELLSDGSFRHLGRSDGVIKVGATRISLSELEARVRELNAVSEVAALPVDAGGARGQEVWLVVATLRGQELPELRAHLLRYYDPVLLPRRVRFVESLPRETTGKLMRSRLLDLFAAQTVETMQP
jgi:4-coumarate--CoA ligase (photoactive yellow protein activation family)